MKFINTLFSLIILALGMISCEVINPDEQIPSYISIDTIVLDTTKENTTNITDAWIFINDEPIGCFELPCKVPILKTGKVKLDIRGGIKINGIGALRTPYPLYVPFISEVDLKAGEIINVSPKIKYNSYFKFKINEQFNQSGTFFTKTSLSDTNFVITPSTEALNNGSYGAINITKAKKTFEISTNSQNVLPKTGVPIFVEMDYKCNHPFTFGLYIQYSDRTIQHSVLNINPSDQWKKIYINLTQIASRETGALNYDLIIGSKLLDNSEDAWFHFDNIRLIY